MPGLHILVLFVGMLVPGLVHGEPQPIRERCTKLDACRCQTDSGLIIDLSPLDSGDYLEPAFKDVPVNEKYQNSTDLYSWNPCTPFCEMHCEGAAVCQNVSKINDFYYTIGMHDDANFVTNYTDTFFNTSVLVLQYSYFSQGLFRYSMIRLFCDEDKDKPEFIPYGESGTKSLHYYFDFISEHACPRNETLPTFLPTPTQPSCPHPWVNWTTTTTTSTTTTATTTSTTATTTSASPNFPNNLTWEIWTAIGCLSVAVLLLLYFVIGLIINLIRGRRGIAVVPNYRFWISCCKCGCCTGCEQEGERNKLLKQYSDDIS